MRSRLVPLVLVTLAGCGRVSFDEGGHDGAVGTQDDATDAPPDRPNVAFVTAAVMRGDFGGQAAADSTCATAAANHGIPGTFVAFVSTSSSDAIDRLAGSRGWVRTDAKPIVDQPSDLLTNGPMFNLIDHDETGARQPLSAVVTWTGSDMNGRYTTNMTCSDWTSQANTVSGQLGYYDHTSPFAIALGPQTCDVSAHLYCFEIGHVAAVTPAVTAGKFVFYSSATPEGLSTFDARCQADATAAGLPGTYLAAVATTTTTIQSRFPAPSEPYVRPDGTQVSATGASMVDGTSFLAPVNQKADGSYVATAFAPASATGALNPTSLGTVAGTCSDWTASSGSGDAGTPIDARSADFWGGTGVTCNAPNLHVICLQQ